VNKNPKINPPVGPAILFNPPMNPENTGSPIHPSIIYISIHKKTETGSRIYEQINTAKSPSDTGTGVKGICIDTGASMHISPLISDINTSFFVDNFFKE
jgi:hypothetical protein